MLIKAQNKMTPALTLKNKKMAKSSHFFYLAELMLSNSNFEVYVGDRWIKIKILLIK